MRMGPATFGRSSGDPCTQRILEGPSGGAGTIDHVGSSPRILWSGVTGVIMIFSYSF